MRKNGVVRKLFVITSIMILFVFSLALLAEGLFFERFYRSTKIDHLEQSIERFGAQYLAAESNQIEASRALGTFMNENNASVAILNSQFEQRSVDPYFIQIATESKLVTLRIASEGMMLNDIPTGLRIGEPLVVDGIFMDENDTIMQPVNFYQDEQGAALPSEGLVRVKGKITDFILPEQRSFNPFYQDTLIRNALMDWLLQKDVHRADLDRNASVRSEWLDPWSGIRYAVLVAPLSTSLDEDRYVFALTSLQPVGEAVDILKQYFIYLAPVILILVLILSLIYSRIISRPLVKLSQSAGRMAQLDFSVQPEIHSKDEFGDLSRSMSTLSQNLNAALQNLQQANEQLHTEMEEKQRSEQLRKELIANISHELKTPLGIVKGFAEGLQDDVAVDKRERYLQLIVSETDRMNALIMDMLELSKFEAKAIQLRLRDIPLGELIHRVAASFAHQLESKKLYIDIQADSDWVVSADSRRLEQVVLNLLSNAIRHASQGSTIRVDIEQLMHGQIKTAIANAGAPIDAEDLARIWDQFYRAERSRDRKSGGTGLGLAIVKHILELHGSTYGAANTDQGVVFHFTLEQAVVK